MSHEERSKHAATPRAITPRTVRELICTHTNRRTRWRVHALWIVCLVVSCVLLVRNMDSFGPIRIGDVVVQRNAAGVAPLLAHAEQWQRAVFTLHVGPYVARYERARLGARLPVASARSAVLALGHSGNPWRDLHDVWVSRRGGLVLPWRVEVTQAALAARLSELRSQLERAPIPGVRLHDGTELAGTPGLTVNVLGSMDSVTRALASGALQAELAVVRVAAPSPVPYETGRYDAQQFTEALAQFSTRYRTQGSASGRARNIELAVRALDGAVLEPGGVLSFNEKVGQRSYARGFEAALEIANRRVVRGIGGGVCQVAATLHAAAFLAGFALPEYRPHSRPSRYIEVGLDTMVSWPEQDMRIANVYPYPVRIHAEADQGVLSVRLEGAGKAHPVEWSKQILQDAAAGLVIKRRRIVYFPTGPVAEEVILRYPRVVMEAPAAAVAAVEQEDF